MSKRALCSGAVQALPEASKSWNWWRWDKINWKLDIGWRLSEGALWSFYVGIINTEDYIWNNQRQLAYVHEQPSEVFSWHCLQVDHILLLNIDPQVTGASLLQVVSTEWAGLRSWIPAKAKQYFFLFGHTMVSVLIVLFMEQSQKGIQRLHPS